MKKTWYAGLACSVLCGSAAAQSTVTLYGIVDAGILRDNNGRVTSTRVDSGLLNASRIGFRGREDLGRGLSANFVLESGLSVDTGAQANATTLFNRQAYVSLNGTFGSIRLGRQETPVYANRVVFDPFEGGMAGSATRLFNYSGNQLNNTVAFAYEAKGLRSQVQYALGETAGNTNALRTYAGYVGYCRNGLDLVAAYTNTNDATGKVSGRNFLIGGNYDLGVVKAYLAYQQNKNITSPAGLITAGADVRNTLAGLRVPVGNGTLIGSYIHLGNRAKADANAHQVAVGYSYALSLRTNVYSSYGQLANGGAVAIQTAANGATDKLFNLGIRHKF